MCLFTPEREPTTNQSDSRVNIQFGKPVCFDWVLGLLRNMDEGVLTGTGCCTTSKLTQHRWQLKKAAMAELSTVHRWPRSPGIFSLQLICPASSLWVIVYAFLSCQGGPSRFFQAFIILLYTSWVLWASPPSWREYLIGRKLPPNTATAMTLEHQCLPFLWVELLLTWKLRLTF